MTILDGGVGTDAGTAGQMGQGAQAGLNGQAGQSGQGGQPPATSGGDWLASLGLPADFEVPGNIKTMKGPGDLVRAYAEANKLISSKGYVPPKPDAPAEVWESWYSKTRPESPDKYSWKPDEAELASLDEPTRKALEGEIGAIKQAAHKAGLDDRQFTAVLAMHEQWVERRQAESEAAQKEAEAKEILEGRNALQQAWGDKFPENLAAAQRTAKALGLFDALKESGMGNNPAMLQALARLDAQLGEAKLVGGGASKETVREQFDKVTAELMGMKPDNPSYSKLNERRLALGKALFT